jgi:hypothetical protein
MAREKMQVVQRAVVTTRRRRRRRPASAIDTRTRPTSNSRRAKSAGRSRSKDRDHQKGELSGFENTAEDHLLASNIHAIESHLQRLHEECMYLEAAKVQEELQKLKAQRHSQNTTYWVERHDRTIAGLRQQRERLFSNAQQRMDGQLRQMQSKLERDQREMAERQEMEIKVLRTALDLSEKERNRTQRPGSPSQKFSGKVLSLLEKEKRLARGRFYERAAKARKDAEKMMAVENEGRKLNDYRLRQGKLSRLVVQHREEKIALQGNFEHKRRKLVAECRTDQNRISVRVRKTRSDLSRARSLRVAMATSSSPVLLDAAKKASSHAEESAATLPLTASPLRRDRSISGGGPNSSSSTTKMIRPRSAHPLTRALLSDKSSSSSGNSGNSHRKKSHQKRTRPSTAPSKRGGRHRPISAAAAAAAMGCGDGDNDGDGNEPEKANMSEAMLHVEEDERESELRGEMDADELDPSSLRRSANRSTRRRRRRRPKSASGWRRRSASKKKVLKQCWWCGECDGHIPKTGGVAVPSSSNPNKGTGNFCSWECASSYVFKYFPIQDRWLSDLLIQDTAGFLVRKSTRPHRRLQGPGIPSINI